MSKEVVLSFLAAMSVMTCNLAQAVVVPKTPTGSDLTDGANWGGIEPGYGDVAAWVTNSLCQGLSLGSYTLWGGLSVVAAPTNIDISGGGLLTIGNGGIDMSSATVNMSIANNIALGSPQTWTVGSTNLLYISGYVDGANDLIKAGSGTVWLSAINPISGVTHVNGGTLVVSGVLHAYDGWRHINALEINTGGTLLVTSGIADSFLGQCNYDAEFNTINGGTLQFGTSSGSSEEINRAFAVGTNSGAIEVLNTNATLTFDYFGDEFQFSVPGGVSLILKGAGRGVMNKSIGGAGGLIKDGPGIWTLNANNTYAGSTIVSNGILFVSGGTGVGPLTVVQGGILAGAGSIGGNVIFAPGGVPQFNSGATMSIAGSLNLNSNTVHLLLPNNLSAGTYTLATYNRTGSLGAFSSVPAIDSGSIVGGATAQITTKAGQVNLVVGPPAPHLAISSINGGTSPNAGKGFDVVVMALDAGGNPLVMATDTNVTLTLNAGTGIMRGTLTGNILAGNSSVTITNLSYSKVEAGVVLNAANTGGTMQDGSSGAFSVNPGLPTYMSLTSGNNWTGVPGLALPNPFMVTVVDGNGNASPGVTVNFALASAPAGATGEALSAPIATTDSNGVARCTLTLGNLSGIYTVTATSGTLIGSPVTFSTTATNNGWVETWADEFDNTGLPDNTKWGYENGFVRNGESQWYTTNRLENACVTNGTLVITARHENAYYPPGEQYPVYYTSASLTTQNTKSFKYGRIEMRAKLPEGLGTWPAMWMLGTNISTVNWPICGELDIMENIGRESDATHDIIHGNAFYAVPSGGTTQVGARQSYYIMNNPQHDFHVYAIEWDANFIKFFVDDSNYFTFNVGDADTGIPNPFRNPQYLILNFAIGGNYNGYQLDNSILPQQYVIDYVRYSTRIPTWDGGGADGKWSSSNNWVGAGPVTGDLAIFASTNQLASVMDYPYSLAGLSFDSTAGSFLIGTSNGSVLTLSGAGINNGSSNLQVLNLPIVLAANQIFTTAGADLFMGGMISGSGFALTKAGTGTLTLGASNTYSGGTTVSVGTLALGTNGSLASGSGINIAAGAKFDVSAIGSFSPGVGGTLTAEGTGTNLMTNAAAIDAGDGGSINLSSNAITLAFDGSDPALFISRGTLSLGGNSFIVNTTNGVALTPGIYPIIRQAAGSVVSNGAFPAVSGTAIGSGQAGAIIVSGNSVNLVVSGSGAPPVFTNLAASQSITYGTGSVTLGGKLGASGPVYPVIGDLVSISINGNTQTTVINDNAGDFSLNYNSSALPASASPYAITYAYAGTAALFLGTTSDMSTTLTVTNAPLFITASNASKSFDGAAFTGGNGVAGSGFVNGDSLASLTGVLSYGGTSQGAVNAGSYAIIPQGLSSSNYNITYVPGTLTVNPLGVTVIADAKTKTYGSADPVLSYQAVPAPVGGDVFSGALSRAPGASAGSYAISRGTLNLGSNYNIIFVGMNLVVTPAQLTVVASNASRSYGTTNPLFTASLSGFVNGESVTNSDVAGAPSLTTTANTNSPVGVYAIVAGTGTLTSTNYVFSYTNGNLTVGAASILVTANNASRSYGTTNPLFTASLSGFVNGEGITNSDVAGAPSLTTTANSNSPVGVYAIVAGAGTLTSTNYVFSYTNGNLTVGAASILVTADNKSRSYGTTNPLFTASLSGFVNGEGITNSDVAGAPSLTTSADTNSPVGVYAIVAGTGTLASTNYVFSYTNGNLSVGAASILVTADNKSRSYGMTNPLFTASLSGFVNGETITNSDVAGAPLLTTSANTNSPVGVYAIVAGTGTLASTNYVFSYTNGNLSVGAASILVTADNKSRSYGTTNPLFTASLSGFVNGESITNSDVAGAPSLTTTANTNSPVGVYAIVAGTGTLTSTNYVFSYTNGNLSVTLASLSITPNNASKFYGQALSFAGTEFTSSGLLEGDTVTNVLLVSGGASISANVGTYPIVASAASGKGLTNYSLQYIDGILAVSVLTPVSLNSPVANHDGSITFSFNGGDNGVSYRVQASDDFLSWSNLATITAGTNGLGSFSDTGLSNHVQRFYRVVTP